MLVRDYPFPPDSGGKIRLWGLLQELQKGFRLTLVCLESVIEPARLEAADQFCERVIFPDAGRDRRWWDILLPGEVRVGRRVGVSGCLSRLLKEESWDVFVCEHLHSSVNVPRVRGLPTVLMQQNVESRILWRALKRVRSFRQALQVLLDAVRTQIYETITCNRYDLVVAVSEVDRKHLSRMSPFSQVEVVENFACQNLREPKVLEESPGPSVCFVGTLDWFPNQDGARFFLESIWPRILARVPDAVFWLVGRGPGRTVCEAAQRTDRVEILGCVPDVQPYVRQAWVNVVPLRIGSGTRLKILEAFGWGKAVVSTTLGAEGLPLTDGVHILLRDRVEEFTEAVVELLLDQAKRAELGRRGRALIDSRLNPQVQGERCRKVLLRLVRR